MKRINLITSATLALAFCLSSCSVDEPLPGQEAGQEAALEEKTDGSIIPGTLIVQLSDTMIKALSGAGSTVETKSAGFNSLADEYGVISMERIFPDGGRFEARHREAGLHRWYRVIFDESQPSTKAAASFESLEGVESVEIPHRIVPTAFNYFNDPYSYYQWQYYNDGSRGTGFRKGSDINVVPVWEEFTAGSSDVIVAVIDGGIDMTHPDLAAVTIPAGEEGSRNFVSIHEDYEIEPTSHGTHVAGSIGAINNNGIGVCGVAGGKDGNGGVRLLSCAIFATGAGGQSISGDESAALVWAADHGAVIANNSWGFEFSEESQARTSAANFENSPSALKSAIDYFIDYAGIDENGKQTGPMKGGVVLFASGNEGWAYGVPAMYDRVVAVGALAHDNSLTAYSNYGDWVDIVAPGGADSDDANQFILSTVPNEGYAWMSGTSMACPHASGVAALLVSYFGDEGFTNDELVEKLLWGAKTGVVRTSGKPIGGGRLDAYGSFTYSGREAVDFITSYNGDFTFKSHESATIVYDIHGNDDERLTVKGTGSGDVVTVECTSTSATIKLNALKGKPGVYKASVVVGQGTPFEKSLDLNFIILDNHAPELSSRISDMVMDAESSASQSIDLGSFISDPDGESLTYTATASSNGVVNLSVSSGSLSIKPAGYGQTSVTVTGTDARGESAKMSFQLLTRDTSRAIDIYPNPVSDYLYIRPASDSEVSVTVFSQSGAKVLEEKAESKLFNPLGLDVKKLGTGIYTVKVSAGGEEVSQTVVKL